MAKHLLLVGLFIICFSTLAFAQSSISAEKASTVTFSINGNISARDTSVSILNLPVFQHLSEEKHLIELNVRDNGTGKWMSAPFSVKFMFKDMNEFANWYNSSFTRKLFNELKNSQGNYTSNLELKRFATLQEDK